MRNSQPTAPDATLPILLVAGFLGAGKTTLMRALIGDAFARGIRVGVIVNEFGVADVDSNLLAEADAEMLDASRAVAPVAAGKKSSSTLWPTPDVLPRQSRRRPFGRGFGRMFGRRRSGDHARCRDRRRIVAAGARRRSGRGCRCFAFAANARGGRTVAVDAAPNRPGRLAGFEQVRLGGEIQSLENRRQSGEAALQISEEFLRECNAGGRIERATKGAFDFAPLWGDALHGAERERAQTALEAAPHAHYQTVNVPVPKALERAKFEASLAALPPQVWRAKGFVRLRENGEERLYVMQFVGGELGGLSGEETHAQWEIAPFDWPADRASQPALDAGFYRAATRPRVARTRFRRTRNHEVIIETPADIACAPSAFATRFSWARTTAARNNSAGCGARTCATPPGNLLLQYGFDRARPPQGVIGASAYQLRLLPDECPRERVIALWGFGFWYGELDESGERGIFIGRAAFEPRWSAHITPPGNAWSPAPIHAATRPPHSKLERQQARVLLKGALNWIAHYESWALAHLGETERCRQLQAWPQSSARIVPPGEFARAWAALAGRLDEPAKSQAQPSSVAEIL